MKNKILLPFALTGLVAALSACGGGGSHINEDPYKGVTATTSGCSSSLVTDSCMMFSLDFPAEGVNFDCSSDKSNHFATEKNGNLFTGGCKVGDTVSFYIQGTKTSRKINLGSVDLSKIRPLKSSTDPVYISLKDIAEGLTGKSMTVMDTSDESFKVMVALTRILQSVAVSEGNQAGAIQEIDLTTDFKNTLSTVTADVDKANYLDGSYISLLQPWVDMNAVDNQTSQNLAKQLINQSGVATYSASRFGIDSPTAGISGFFALSQLTNRYAIADMILLTTRSGHTIGYATEWIGQPKLGTGETNSNARNLLPLQVPPTKMNANMQVSLINPLSNKISKAFLLNSDKAEESSNTISLNQGVLYNNNKIAGNQYVYTAITKDTGTAPANVLGKWSQTVGGEVFNGTIDIDKIYPVTYLDQSVFKTLNSVAKGEQYIFPLYATLTFKFDNTITGVATIPDTKLSIVIDENGDIRTNLGANGSLTSDECPTLDSKTYKDSKNVQQYLIGTTGTTNYSESDKSITARIILANPVFGVLDGAMAGVNSFAITGIRFNLQNLLQNHTTVDGINVTGWNGALVTNALWENTFAGAQNSFNTAKDNSPTLDQKNIAQRRSGTIQSFVELPSCYKIKTKI